MQTQELKFKIKKKEGEMKCISAGGSPSLIYRDDYPRLIAAGSGTNC